MLNFEPEGKVVAVTGAASGIGAALVRRLAEQGARAIAVLDRDLEGATATARVVDARAWQLDVADEQAVARVLTQVQEALGELDLYCSNAGVLMLDLPDWTVVSQTTEQWRRSIEVNVMAHVHACRTLLPAMIARGHGAFLITASAAGLLSSLGDAAYSTSKHAALGFAESLAITHGDDGIYVGVLCPQGVDTGMTRAVGDTAAGIDGMLTADAVACFVLEAMAQGRFMIRPHEQVTDYFKRKAEDYDRWVGGMRKLRRSRLERTGRPA